MGNGYGDVSVTRKVDMAYYDDAPPPLRWLMRNAVTPFSAVHMVNDYWHLREVQNLKHVQAVGILTEAVERRDREMTVRAYGRTHPEAQGPIVREAFA